jgi:hypothetical protein
MWLHSMGAGAPDFSGASKVMSDIVRLQDMSANQIFTEYENTMLAVLFLFLCLLLLARQLQNQQAARPAAAVAEPPQ